MRNNGDGTGSRTAADHLLDRPDDPSLRVDRTLPASHRFVRVRKEGVRDLLEFVWRQPKEVLAMRGAGIVQSTAAGVGFVELSVPLVRGMGPDVQRPTARIEITVSE